MHPYIHRWAEENANIYDYYHKRPCTIPDRIYDERLDGHQTDDGEDRAAICDSFPSLSTLVNASSLSRCFEKPRSIGVTYQHIHMPCWPQDEMYRRASSPAEN